MLRPVRLARSVSVASPPASAMVSSRNKARSTDWMLWPSPSRVRDARDLAPGPGRIVAFIGRFSLAGRENPRPGGVKAFQHKERDFQDVKETNACFFRKTSGWQPVPARFREPH